MEKIHCYWAVCYDADGKHFDDRKKKSFVTALFSNPFQAEDFIEKVLPKETKDRFYIEHISECEIKKE